MCCIRLDKSFTICLISIHFLRLQLLKDISVWGSSLHQVREMWNLRCKKYFVLWYLLTLRVGILFFSIYLSRKIQFCNVICSLSQVSEMMCQSSYSDRILHRKQVCQESAEDAKGCSWHYNSSPQSPIEGRTTCTAEEPPLWCIHAQVGTKKLWNIQLGNKGCNDATRVSNSYLTLRL